MMPTSSRAGAGAVPSAVPGETGYVTDPPVTDPQAAPLANDVEDDSAWYERALRSVQQSQQQSDESVVVVRPDAPAERVGAADEAGGERPSCAAARNLIAVASRCPCGLPTSSPPRRDWLDGTRSPPSSTSPPASELGDPTLESEGLMALMQGPSGARARHR